MLWTWISTCELNAEVAVSTSARPGRVTTQERVTDGDSVAGRTYPCTASRDSKTETSRMATSSQSSTKTSIIGAGPPGLTPLKCLWSMSAGPGRHFRALPCTGCAPGARPAKVLPARRHGGRSRLRARLRPLNCRREVSPRVQH
jgi:hypothetical protein